jgi:hypothetical protein
VSKYYGGGYSVYDRGRGRREILTSKMETTKLNGDYKT